MKTLTLITMLTAISCAPKESDTAIENPDTAIEDTDTEETDTEDSDTEDTDTEDTDTEDTDTEDTDTEDTDTDDTDTDDTDIEDPLANATCDLEYAECTEQDFDRNDLRNTAGVISINMVGMQPYSPKCATVKVGQTVQIGATSGHPFKKECAEDSVMDSQDGNTSQVEFTFTTAGYYNYSGAVTSHSSMVGNIRVLPE